MAIEQLQHTFNGQFTKQHMFDSLSISRQSFHQHKKVQHAKLVQENLLIALVLKWRIKHPRMGARALYKTIQNAGQGAQLTIGINKFEQLLSRYHLNVKKCKSFVPRTTDSKGSKYYPNLIDALKVNEINRVIVADITYYWLGKRWSYIFGFKDVYSQRILALIPSLNLEAENAVQGLKQIVRQRTKAALTNCIFHSDNGSQYEATTFIEQLNDLDMKISRAETCQQNGSAEQLNNLVKNMYLIPWQIHTFNQLKRACKKLMKLNNQERAIHQLGYRSPLQFEQWIQTIPADQRPIKKLFKFKKDKE